MDHETGDIPHRRKFGISELDCSQNSVRGRVRHQTRPCSRIRRPVRQKKHRHRRLYPREKTRHQNRHASQYGTSIISKTDNRPRRLDLVQTMFGWFHGNLPLVLPCPSEVFDR